MFESGLGYVQLTRPPVDPENFVVNVEDARVDECPSYEKSGQQQSFVYRL